MKKANTEARNAAAQTLVARPDSQIDTSAIPGITGWTGAVRGLFARPEMRQISIRLAADGSGNRKPASRRERPPVSDVHQIPAT